MFFENISWLMSMMNTLRFIPVILEKTGCFGGSPETAPKLVVLVLVFGGHT